MTGEAAPPASPPASPPPHYDRPPGKVSATRAWTLEDAVDGGFFVAGAVLVLWLGWLLLDRGLRLSPSTVAYLLLFWLLVAYLGLPRLQEALARVYVPDYFIGRTVVGDGMLGDPVNLALDGTEDDLHAALTRAGWVRSDEVTLRSGWRIVVSAVLRRSYPHAPVSPLYLFGRRQAFAYEQQVDGNPAQRHHVRFWPVPDSWTLPGGRRVGWLAAATYDRAVGLSLFTLQVTHKVDADIDVERDYVVATLRYADPTVPVHVLTAFSAAYHARNGGGDRIETDGDLPVVELGPSPNPPEAAAAGVTDSRDRRPVQTVFGGGVALVRCVLFLLGGVGILVAPDVVLRIYHEQASEVPQLAELWVRVAAACTLALIGFVELGLGVAVLAGRNWARMLLMVSAVGSTLVAFVSNLDGSDRVTLLDLPTTSTAILLLLALSSHRARDFAARGHPLRKRVSAAQPAHLTS